jgi:REP element-mobilizing transposase RayT
MINPGSAGVPPAHGNAGVPPAKAAADAGGTPALPGWHSRGYLPHFDKPGLTQSLTFRLFDSVPADVIEKWRKELAWTEYVAASDPRAVELRKRIAEYEDQGYGACWLRRDDCAEIVQNAMLHFDAERYALIEWCVMPNHVHALIEVYPDWTLESILHAWKSFTSKTCNRLLGRTGRFWMPEYHDRFIRGPKHFENAVDYIRQNPVKAGLCKQPEDWRWSSPGTRASRPQRAGGTPALPGMPLPSAQPFARSHP